jgi:hypothetical protein
MVTEEKPFGKTGLKKGAYLFLRECLAERIHGRIYPKQV